MLNKSQIEEFAAKSTWVLDVDDCLYDIDCGLHDFIKENIIRTFNELAANKSRGSALVSRLEEILVAQNLSVKNPRNITREELGLAFPPIVRAIEDVAPGEFDRYMEAFYGDRYKLIVPDPALVDAFYKAQASDVEIFFYTNGPSGKTPGSRLHVQKVLERHGFDTAFIEDTRTCTYDLQMGTHAGRGKPTVEGMQDFLNFSGIDPNCALMADDQVKNLKTARDAGLKALWTWTAARPPLTTDMDLAGQLDIPRVRHTGNTLRQIAMARAAAPAFKKMG